jgi:hypothetical protein
VAALIRGPGFHGGARPGVRQPRYRELPPKVRGEIAGTNCETLRRMYDEVTVEEMRNAMRKGPSGGLKRRPPDSRNRQQRGVEAGR